MIHSSLLFALANSHIIQLPNQTMHNVATAATAVAVAAAKAPKSTNGDRDRTKKQKEKFAISFVFSLFYSQTYTYRDIYMRQFVASKRYDCKLIGCSLQNNKTYKKSNEFVVFNDFECFVVVFCFARCHSSLSCIFQFATHIWIFMVFMHSPRVHLKCYICWVPLLRLCCYYY